MERRRGRWEESLARLVEALRYDPRSGIRSFDVGDNYFSLRLFGEADRYLDRAMTLGKGPASKRIVILSDPDCHFCGKLHEETKKVRAKDPEVSFSVLLFSRNNDAAVGRRAAAALCAGTEEALDRAYEGKDLGDPPCGPEAVEAIAEALQRLHDQPQERERLALEGRRRVMSEYTDAAIAEKTLRFWRDAIAATA